MINATKPVNRLRKNAERGVGDGAEHPIQFGNHHDQTAPARYVQELGTCRAAGQRVPPDTPASL
jgi:hypothetical protein